MQPTSLAVTPAAPRANARDAPAAPALTLAADTRSVRQHQREILQRTGGIVHRSWPVSVAIMIVLVVSVVSSHGFPHAGEPERGDYDDVETAPMPLPMVLVMFGVPAIIVAWAFIGSWWNGRKSANTRVED